MFLLCYVSFFSDYFFFIISFLYGWLQTAAGQNTYTYTAKVLPKWMVFFLLLGILNNRKESSNREENYLSVGHIEWVVCVFALCTRALAGTTGINSRWTRRRWTGMLYLSFTNTPDCMLVVCCSPHWYRNINREFIYRRRRSKLLVLGIACTCVSVGTGHRWEVKDSFTEETADSHIYMYIIYTYIYVYLKNTCSLHTYAITICVLCMCMIYVHCAYAYDMCCWMCRHSLAEQHGLQWIVWTESKTGTLLFPLNKFNCIISIVPTRHWYSP